MDTRGAWTWTWMTMAFLDVHGDPLEIRLRSRLPGARSLPRGALRNRTVVFRIRTRRMCIRITRELSRRYRSATMMTSGQPAVSTCAIGDDSFALRSRPLPSPFLPLTCSSLPLSGSVVTRVAVSCFYARTWPSAGTMPSPPRALDLNLILESTFNHYIIFICMYVYIYIVCI